MQTTPNVSAAIGLAALTVTALPVPAPAAPQGGANIVQVAQSTGRFDTLLAAVDAAGLTATLQGPGPFTVFAPTDAAFAAIPADRIAFLLDPANVGALQSVLLYHVAGVVNTLLAAVDAADLTAALQGPGPFTVLAPTDAAFGKLPPGTVANLLLPQHKHQLVDILTYHVIPLKAYSEQALTAGTVSTLQGDTVTFTTSGGDLFVEGVLILQADLDASNGVIHVIDAVLIP